jgi:ribosomal RNA assembly protein
MESILIPRERAGIINKKVIEKIKDELGITIVKNRNVIELGGEGIEYLLARNIIMAIGRGFSPVRAYRLLDEEQELLITELGNRAQRIRARLIGTNGKARKRIEWKTGVAISVLGKTVAIIGNWEEMNKARKAVEMLINGTSHTYVYRWLDEVIGN